MCRPTSVRRVMRSKKNARADIGNMSMVDSRNSRQLAFHVQFTGNLCGCPVWRLIHHVHSVLIVQKIQEKHSKPPIGRDATPFGKFDQRHLAKSSSLASEIVHRPASRPRHPSQTWFPVSHGPQCLQLFFHVQVHIRRKRSAGSAAPQTSAVGRETQLLFLSLTVSLWKALLAESICGRRSHETASRFRCAFLAGSKAVVLLLERSSASWLRSRGAHRTSIPTHVVAICAASSKTTPQSGNSVITRLIVREGWHVRTVQLYFTCLPRWVRKPPESRVPRTPRVASWHGGASPLRRNAQGRVPRVTCGEKHGDVQVERCQSGPLLVRLPRVHPPPWHRTAMPQPTGSHFLALAVPHSLDFPSQVFGCSQDVKCSGLVDPRVCRRQERQVSQSKRATDKASRRGPSEVSWKCDPISKQARVPALLQDSFNKEPEKRLQRKYHMS